MALAVVPIWNLLVGFPGEKSSVFEDYRRALPSLTHLVPPTGAFAVRFDRYSPYFVQARSYGLELRALPYYSLCYPFPAAAIENVAYYFVDTNESAPYSAEAKRCLPELSGSIDWWRGRFTGRDDTIPARLELCRSGEDIIYVEDTRDGIEKRIALSAEELSLLLSLEQPVSERVIEENGHADTLERLDAKGLLFSERGRFMSLVINAHADEAVH